MPTRGTATAISAPTVFDGGRLLPNHCVVVLGDAITQLLPTAQCPAGLDVITLEHGILAPGFIDLQVNGGGDLMLNNAPERATVNAMHSAHRALGTTSMLPTVMSDTREVQQAAVNAVRAARTAGNPGIAGIHIEGPFFAPARRGAHNAAMSRPAENRDIDWLCALEDLRVIVTLAPEHVSPDQIERLARSGVHVCAGHTDASYQQIRDASARGLRGITHLYNAMRPLSARDPGTVGAALDDDSLWAGIIADGHHVHPANIRLAHAAKPGGKLVLVSDAMATAGGKRPSFDLYGENIREHNGCLINADGALAGSTIGLIDAVRYAHLGAGIPLEECLRMASLYPAAVLKLDGTLGHIASGCRADLVHFNEDFMVCNTWLAGQRQSHNHSY